MNIAPSAGKINTIKYIRCDYDYYVQYIETGLGDYVRAYNIVNKPIRQQLGMLLPNRWCKKIVFKSVLFSFYVR